MSAEQNSSSETPPLDQGIGEYMAFSLGAEEYAVEILRVLEIRGWEAVTRIPNSPKYVKGVFNLRGTIIPVFDLRQRLGMPFRAYEKETVVIVLRVQNGDKEKKIGLVVDKVSGVLDAATEQIQSPPEFGAHLKVDFIKGLVTANEKMVMLLNADKLPHFMCAGSDADSSAASRGIETIEKETGADGSENQSSGNG